MYGTSQSPVNERRTNPRFRLKLSLCVRSPQPAGTAEIQTESIDVSSRGIYFLFPHVIESGMRLEFTMLLPNDLTQAGLVKVRCLGRVVRVSCESGRTGVAMAIDRYEFIRS